MLYLLPTCIIMLAKYGKDSISLQSPVTYQFETVRVQEKIWACNAQRLASIPFWHCRNRNYGKPIFNPWFTWWGKRFWSAAVVELVYNFDVKSAASVWKGESTAKVTLKLFFWGGGGHIHINIHNIYIHIFNIYIYIYIYGLQPWSHNHPSHACTCGVMKIEDRVFLSA